VSIRIATPWGLSVKNQKNGGKKIILTSTQEVDIIRPKKMGSKTEQEDASYACFWRLSNHLKESILFFRLEVKLSDKKLLLFGLCWKAIFFGAKKGKTVNC
jgi:hypothetical protein